MYSVRMHFMVRVCPLVARMLSVAYESSDVATTEAQQKKTCQQEVTSIYRVSALSPPVYLGAVSWR